MERYGVESEEKEGKHICAMAEFGAICGMQEGGNGEPT